MKKPATINEAIKEAFKREGKPLRVKEVYWRIKEDNLYLFNTATPEQVVRTALRRHSESLNFPTSSHNKLYLTLEDGRYWLIGKSVTSAEGHVTVKQEVNIFDHLKGIHDQYLTDFKQHLLVSLKAMEPHAFENFCKHLLIAYGFSDVVVTKKSRDGGIDGYGNFKIGLSHVKVAFQCKRYADTPIRRGHIAEFRGNMPWDYQQGILFTTSTFTKDAKEVAFLIGKVPIVLIDGTEIVNFMIEKKIGVEVEELPIYTNAIDLILQEEQ